DQFVLKGALLFAIRVGEQYRPTRDLDLLGLGEASEAAVATAIRDIVATKVDDDGLVFDVDGLEVHPIREENVYGGIRAIMQARLVKRERLRDFESLSQVVEELRVFLSRPFEHVKTKQPFDARWAPGGPWT